MYEQKNEPDTGSEGQELSICAETPRKVEVIQVIHVQAIRGRGTDENPIRLINQYYSFDGKLLGEF